MNIESRLEKLERANRRYRATLTIVLGLSLTVVFAAAKAQFGDVLVTPVTFRTVDDRAVLEVTDDGVLEFLQYGTSEARWDADAVHQHSFQLSELQLGFERHQSTLREVERTLREHEAKLKAVDRHLRRDRSHSRGP